MSNENWRTDVDSGDYFLHQQKKLAIENRRPVVRRAFDLVGPGIGAQAVRLDDYNNLLATFNGYYSSAPGATNAPNSTEAFVGQVVSDASLGGRQVFTGLTSGIEYRRTFTRSPTSRETIGWGAWSGDRIPPTAQGFNKVDTSAASGVNAVLTPPNLTIIGVGGTYERSGAGILVLKQGVYTGSIQVGANVAGVVGDISFFRPDGATSTQSTQTGVLLDSTYHIPFTVYATDGAQGFSVLFYQTSGTDRTVWWRFSCTRVGDAA